MHAYLSTPSTSHHARIQHAPLVTGGLALAAHKWSLPARRLRKAKLCYLAAFPESIHQSKVSVFKLFMTRANVEMRGNGTAKGLSPTPARSPAFDALMYPQRRLHRSSWLWKVEFWWFSCQSEQPSYKSMKIASVWNPFSTHFHSITKMLDAVRARSSKPDGLPTRKRSRETPRLASIGPDGGLSSGFRPATLRIPWRRQAP